MSRFLPRITPRSVTITRWGVFILGVASGWQAAAIWQQAAVLQEFNLVILSNARLLLASIWSVVFIALGVAIWFRRPWVRTAVPVALFVYTLYHLTLLILAQSPPAQAGWPADALFGLAGTLFSLWALRRTAAAAYFAQVELES